MVLDDNSGRWTSESVQDRNLSQSIYRWKLNFGCTSIQDSHHHHHSSIRFSLIHFRMMDKNLSPVSLHLAWETKTETQNFHTAKLLYTHLNFFFIIFLLIFKFENWSFSCSDLVGQSFSCYAPPSRLNDTFDLFRSTTGSTGVVFA